MEEVIRMMRFIVVHRLPVSATQDEVIAAGRAIAATPSSDGAKWLRGWVVPGDERFLCEWEAPKESAVRAVLKDVDLFPLEAIYPVTAVCPAWFAPEETVGTVRGACDATARAPGGTGLQ